MSLIGQTCGVRMFKGPCPEECRFGCDRCQIGCWNPAVYRNPFYKTDFATDAYWWRGGYNYAEFLCAECYDWMVDDAKETEFFYRDNDDNYEENPEYTKILETL